MQMIDLGHWNCMQLPLGDGHGECPPSHQSEVVSHGICGNPTTNVHQRESWETEGRTASATTTGLARAVGRSVFTLPLDVKCMYGQPSVHSYCCKGFEWKSSIYWPKTQRINGQQIQNASFDRSMQVTVKRALERIGSFRCKQTQ